MKFLIFVINVSSCLQEIVNHIDRCYEDLKSSSTECRGFLTLVFLTHLMEGIDALDLKSFEMNPNVRISFDLFLLQLRNMLDNLYQSLKDNRNFERIKEATYKRIKELEKKIMEYSDEKCKKFIYCVDACTINWTKFFNESLTYQEIYDWYEKNIELILKAINTDITSLDPSKLILVTRIFFNEFVNYQCLLTKRF